MGIREAIEKAIRAEGEAKGEAKAYKENTFGMLSEGLKPEAIVRITKLPIETILEWQKEWEAQN